MKSALTILIVEDDEGHALLIQQTLEEEFGLTDRIKHFRNGQDALDFFFQRTDCGGSRGAGPYLMLLDIRMAKVDGIEVLRRIKMDPEFKKLPVIMLTTTDNSRDIEKCHILGCNAYIKKSVDSDHFADAIRRIGQLAGLLLVPGVSAR